MSQHRLAAPFTAREQQLGGRVTALLWAAAAALVATLYLWAATPAAAL
jgi:hypothetical protein